MTSARAPLAAMVALLWVVGHAPVLLGGRTFDGPVHSGETLVWHQQVADAIAAGHLPEWDDASGLGAPLAGRRAAIYPPLWLEAILPMPWGADAVLLLHLFLFGLGVALWARRLEADPASAAAAGGGAIVSGLAIGLAGGGGAILAAAWLPWIGWAADRMAERPGRAVGLAALVGAMLLAGPTGAALAAPVVAAAPLVARGAGLRIWLALAAALGSALLLAAAALLPAAVIGDLAPPAAPSHLVHPVDLPLLAFALLAALVRPPLRRLGLFAAVLVAAGFLSPVARDGALAGGLAIGWALAGVGLAHAFAWLLRSEERWRATAAALVAAGVLGPPAFRVWRGGIARAEIERPPALVAGLGEAPEVRARIGWPDRASRPYRDGPPDTAARFGYAYLPGSDAEVTGLWRASSGAGERLLDLFDVEYVLVPASVATPAALEVVGATGRGDWVLARNPGRRPRAFVAPRWSWHRDPRALAGELFPAAPDQRSHAALGAVRLVGSGPASPAVTGPQPAPACRISTPRPEAVDLTCRSTTGGYAVLLDRHAPGWIATVDGREVAIERADLLVRAVKIAPGEHRIQFRYRSPGLRLSLAVSGLAWLVLVALGFALRRLRGTTRRRP